MAIYHDRPQAEVIFDLDVDKIRTAGHGPVSVMNYERVSVI